MALIMTLSHDEREAAFAKLRHQVNHFSHRHPLQLLSRVDHGKAAVCAGCELDVSGSAYACTKPTCAFLLHDLCFDLPRRVRHRCHPDHGPLLLLSSPPYGDGEFACDACGRSGHGFTYHCGACDYDLHVECAALPEVEIRRDHEHPLALSGKMDGGDDVVWCYVCNDAIGRSCWMYRCLDCNCGTHLECAHK